MMRFTRRLAVTGLAAIVLAACGQAGGEDSGAPVSGGEIENAALGDVIKGDPNAPVEIIEYASWTCAACLDFDQRVMPMIESEYIETGKAKLILREFPTAPANIAVAGFALARCAGEENYYPMIDELFDRQQGILAVARQGDQVRAALEQVASNHGIVGAANFDACLGSQDVRRAIGEKIDQGDQKGVSATPTVFVNGERLEGFDWRNPEGMRAILDEALGVSDEVELSDPDSEPEPSEEAPE